MTGLYPIRDTELGTQAIEHLTIQRAKRVDFEIIVTDLIASLQEKPRKHCGHESRAGNNSLASANAQNRVMHGTSVELSQPFTADQDGPGKVEWRAQEQAPVASDDQDGVQVVQIIAAKYLQVPIIKCTFMESHPCHWDVARVKICGKHIPLHRAWHCFGPHSICDSHLPKMGRGKHGFHAARWGLHGRVGPVNQTILYDYPYVHVGQSAFAQVPLEALIPFLIGYLTQLARRPVQKEWQEDR